jgi:glycosyltransferase involved in cell wall biosynthesis
MNTAIFTDGRWQGAHGIGRYATEVLKRLSIPVLSNLKGKPTDPLDSIRLGRELRRVKANVFYNPGFNAPLGWNGTSLLTIHDLIHLDDPRQASWIKRQYYEQVIKRSVLKAPVVFTVSEQSKQRILNWLNIAEERVVIAANGISPSFRMTPEVKPKLNALVYVGTSRPHKNTARMIEAFSLTKNRETELKWVGDISAPDIALIQKLNLTPRVTFYKNIDDTQLANLYQSSRGTLLVSTIEGFGLPPIESIFSGTPALISENNPLVPTLKNLVSIANPLSVTELTEQMNVLIEGRAFSKDEFADIEKLRTVFSWDNTASIISRNLQALRE